MPLLIFGLLAGGSTVWVFGGAGDKIRNAALVVGVGYVAWRFGPAILKAMKS